ncbi:LOW QUALITY PROTEIN: olfactory receptor 10H2-like [Polymixia lowei]
MFVNIGYYRYPAFVLCFLLYVVIVSANLVIILVISREKALHEPMYIFILCLSINSLYGSAGFFLRFLRDLLSDTHLISRLACFTQIYVIYTYASYELTILSIMAYDRYVAICRPLEYNCLMTKQKVSLLCLIRTGLRSIEDRGKFMQTCVPHLLSLFALLFDVMYIRFSSGDLSQSLKNLLSIEFLIIPPILNPLIYGFKLIQINRILSFVFFLKKN